MYNKILWSGFLATVAILTATTSAIANDKGGTTNHDNGAYSTGNMIISPVPTSNLSVTQFNPETGQMSGGIINNPVEIVTGAAAGAGLGASSGSGSGSGASAGDGTVASENGEGESNNTALGKGECTTIACLSAKDGSQEITLNDAAELLENSLDTSAENLAAAEEKSRIAANTRRNALDKEVRHIARNSSSCPNPDYSPTQANQVDGSSITEVREVLERQIAESQKFIEQVNLIDPERNLW